MHWETPANHISPNNGPLISCVQATTITPTPEQTFRAAAEIDSGGPADVPMGDKK